MNEINIGRKKGKGKNDGKKQRKTFEGENQRSKEDREMGKEITPPPPKKKK